jgi:tetratricopeptide repeat protein 21B
VLTLRKARQAAPARI